MVVFVWVSTIEIRSDEVSSCLSINSQFDRLWEMNEINIRKYSNNKRKLINSKQYVHNIKFTTKRIDFRKNCPLFISHEKMCEISFQNLFKMKRI